MAVGLERPHAEFLGQGEGLTVVGGSGLDCWGSAMRSNLAAEAQGVGVGPTLHVDPGKLTGTLSEVAGVLYTTGE
jgi:hypothetical protein